MIRGFLEQTRNMWSKEGQRFSRGILGSFGGFSTGFSDVGDGFRGFWAVLEVSRLSLRS